MLPCAALADPAGPAFSFSACPMPVSLTSPCEDVGGFSLIRFSRCPLDSSTTGSHGSNRACLGLLWCPFLTRPSNPHTGSHKTFFSCPYLLYFSPTGKSWVDLAPVLPIPPRSAHNCPTRLQQGGEPVLQVLLPYPAPKTAHRATQARVWISPSFSPWLSHRHPS